MKATGIVRRIDELGRVVVPKEIRRNLHIREGDQIEIFTDAGGQMVLKKYSPIGEWKELAVQCAEALALTTGFTAAVADREQILWAAGPCRKELMARSLSGEMEGIIDGRRQVLSSGEEGGYHSVFGEQEHFAWEVICPILSQGDAVGAVMLVSRNLQMEMGEKERLVISAVANFLGRQLEN